MRKMIGFLLSCLCSLTLTAQQLRGRIIDEDGQPLEYVNIVISQLPDTSFIKGTISDANGEYVLPDTGDLLTYSYIGYQTTYIKVSEFKKEITLKTDQKILNEVVVKGNLPTSKLTADGLKTQIKGSVLSKAGTANDVLRQIPLLKEENGSFSVFGKGSPLIYINGRELHDLTELEQISSDDIKHIEIITDPGARYDASVKSVIRIRTVKPVGEGIGLSVHSEYFQAEKEDLAEQFNLYYRHKGFDLFGMFRYNRNHSWQKSILSQSVFVDTLWQQQNKMRVDGFRQNYQTSLGFNYQVNDNHIFGSLFKDVFGQKNKGRSSVESLVLANGNYFDHWQNSESKPTKNDPAYNWNVYYTGNIGKLTTDFNFDLLWNGQNSRSNVKEESEEQDDRIIDSENEVRNRFLATNLILEYPLLGGTLQGGTEYSRIHRTDNYINHQQILPSTFSQQKEQNFSSFISYSRLFKFGILKAGLRYEKVKFDYYENDIYSPENSRKYGDFFPDISFGTQLKDLQMRIGYNSKVHRPSFSQLSNNVFYGNRYTLQTGNPLLKPAVTHDFTLQSSWKFLMMQLSYQRENDAIIYSGEQLEENPAVTKVMFKNLDRLRTLSFYLSAGPVFGIYQPRINVGVRKQWLNYLSNQVKVQLNRPLYNLEFSQTLKLPHDFLFTLNFYYQTKGDYQNVYLNTTQYIMEVSLTKTFLNDCLSLQLKGYDLLDGYRDGNLLYNKQMQIDMLNKYDRRRVGLVVQYKFNTTKRKYKGSGAGNENKGRL